MVVEGVDNPSNIGSIIRNVAALGWDGLILDHTSADPLPDDRSASAMGTVFALPHARTIDARGRSATPSTDSTLYAMTPDPTPQCHSTRFVRARKVAVLIGSERAGLSDELLALATPVRIPMADGVDSLNAAAATAVACYALRKQSR